MGWSESNARIFADSRRRWETEPALRDAMARARDAAVLVRESDPLPCRAGARRCENGMRVTVSKKRSFEAAAGYPGRRVCVLNFASAVNPGGAVEYGASAQEECLCRCSTLYPSLNTQAMWDGFYTPHREAADPLNNADCIYTPGVTVFRSDAPGEPLLPEAARYTVDVLSCAAPDLRGGACPEARLRALLDRRVRRILDLAAEMGAEVLILGAFGCGVFGNPPALVAAAFRDALADYRQYFDAAEFAILCAPGREANYRAFAEAFAREA